MTSKDYTKLKKGFNPVINCPAIIAATFKIEPAYIKMALDNPFHGMSYDNPQTHIENSLAICDTF